MSISDIISRMGLKYSDFKSSDLKLAGKKLKKSVQEAEDFLRCCERKTGNIKAPAKCRIIAQSRPFAEWPIYKVSSEIQKFIYSVKNDDLKKYEPGTSKSDHDEWFSKTGVDSFGYRNVQGLNLIFKNAIKTYKGVIKKVENRNKKKGARISFLNKERGGKEKFIPETAFDDNGYLKNKPGINNSIFCYQAVSIRSFDKSRSKISIDIDYNRNGDFLIKLGKSIDRLNNKEGFPGYIPPFQRSTIKKYGRIKNPSHSISDALLYQISIGDDYVIFDGRGLLRNATWRKLIPNGEITIDQLLNMFSGDPVIDVKRNEVVLLYKENVIKIWSKKPLKTKKGHETLSELVKNERLALVSVDLNVNNPITARASIINEKLKSEFIASYELPSNLMDQIIQYKAAVDLLEEECYSNAVNSLTEKEVEKIKKFHSNTSIKSKKALCEKFEIIESDLPWDEMTGNTYNIADFLVKKKGFSKETVVSRYNNRKMSDLAFSNMDGIRDKLPQDLRKILNERIWNEKRGNEKFISLSKRKAELAARCVNSVERWARKTTKCSTVVFAIEDLDIVKKFDGKGKRDKGWDSFFFRKKENRWLIPALHSAFTNLSVNKGRMVIEAYPQYTSITCPKCDFCHAGNRHGEEFKCLSCGAQYNTDIYVAPFNIERVVLTGNKLVKPKVESQGGAKKPGASRTKKNPTKSSGKSSASQPVSSSSVKPAA